jgi:HK97 gp10 family phage protein
MIGQGRIVGGNRVRRLVQAIEKQDRTITEPLKEALADSAADVEDAIRFEIVAQGAVDEGDLLDAVSKKRLSSGFRWKIGFLRKGNLRNWRKAGWRAHFVEFGTRTQRPRPVVQRGFKSTVRQVRRRIRTETRKAFRRFVRR